MSTPRLQRAEIRLQELLSHEKELRRMGFQIIAGIDEAGRGSLAGPVVAACVITCAGDGIPGVDDSKKLSPGKREELFEKITAQAPAFGIGSASVEAIDEVNILEATKLASIEALRAAGMTPDYLVTDSLNLEVALPIEAMVRADSRVYCVAAASILAKVYRDRLMEKLDKEYPGYGFAKNKGYGTKEHRDAIKRLGPSPVHRPLFLRKILRVGL